MPPPPAPTAPAARPVPPPVATPSVATPPAVHDPARLAALHASGLLYRPAPADVYGRVARLAARAVGAPVAQVNVVTDAAQLPVAAHADPPHDVAAWQHAVGLDASYCQHVVGGGAPLLIGDARAHPLVRESRATTDAGIVAYAGVPLHAADGAVLGSVCVVDFAERRWTPADVAALEDLAGVAAAEVALAMREARYRALAHAVGEIVWTTGPDGQAADLPAWRAYTGQTPDAVRGWGWLGALHPDDRPHTQAAWRRAVDARAAYDAEYRVRGADGAYRWFHARAVPVLSGGDQPVILEWVGCCIDVDARRRAEAALASTSAQLHDHAAELEVANGQLQEQAVDLETHATELRETAARLEERTAAAERERRLAAEANLAKGQFLAVMSHELRTPLNAIGGYAQLLEMGLHGPVTDDQRQAIGRVQRAQQRLLGLINDVLNYARLEGGRVEYDLGPVDVAAVVAEVAPLVVPQLAAKGLAFDVPAPGAPRLARADREKLGQVLLNLLSNAAKFTAPGGRVAVTVDDGDGVVRLRVADTGRGISADQQERIFEPFVQVGRGYTSPDEGTGLGLAISRDLARGMGGDLTVGSREGAGATFTVTLPAVAP